MLPKPLPLPQKNLGHIYLSDFLSLFQKALSKKNQKTPARKSQNSIKAKKPNLVNAGTAVPCNPLEEPRKFLIHVFRNMANPVFLRRRDRKPPLQNVEYGHRFLSFFLSEDFLFRFSQSLEFRAATIRSSRFGFERSAGLGKRAVALKMGDESRN